MLITHYCYKVRLYFTASLAAICGHVINVDQWNVSRSILWQFLEILLKIGYLCSLSQFLFVLTF